MVSRGGEIWFSETGLPPYELVTSKRVYPPYEGNYEDPVVWRTNIQYHMIVNDWLGRIAYYLRSKDGIHWKLDAGEGETWKILTTGTLPKLTYFEKLMFEYETRKFKDRE